MSRHRTRKESQLEVMSTVFSNSWRNEVEVEAAQSLGRAVSLGFQKPARCCTIAKECSFCRKKIASGEVTYGHLVFRFDFKDWKVVKVPERCTALQTKQYPPEIELDSRDGDIRFMKEIVGDGEQLMPRRSYKVNKSSNPQGDLLCEDSQTTPSTTSIRKLSRKSQLGKAWLSLILINRLWKTHPCAIAVKKTLMPFEKGSVK